MIFLSTLADKMYRPVPYVSFSLSKFSLKPLHDVKITLSFMSGRFVVIIRSIKDIISKSSMLPPKSDSSLNVTFSRCF